MLFALLAAALWGTLPLAVAVAQTDGTAVPRPVAAPAVLRPGDLVRIDVWTRKDLSGEFTVGPDGNIIHPLYREVHVAGEPPDVVEQRIRTFLQKFQADPQITVEPLVHVLVTGQVRQPNLLTVPPQTTVVQAIALAGGFTETAKLNDVRLRRNGRDIRIDLTTPDLGIANEPIQSGDQIYVARRRSIFTDFVLPVASLTTVVLQIVSLARQH